MEEPTSSPALDEPTSSSAPHNGRADQLAIPLSATRCPTMCIIRSPVPTKAAAAELDVVVFGATGFTGRLAAEYLVRNYGPSSKNPLKIGLAGRSLRKLIRLREQLEFLLASNSQASPTVNDSRPDNDRGAAAASEAADAQLKERGTKWTHVTSLKNPPVLAQVPLLEADSSDTSSLVRLASRCRAVASFVGPYEKYGEVLIQACLEAGTHYCDISAEFHWIHKMQHKFGPAAAAKQIKVVHFCGLESLPMDLAVFLVQKHAVSHYGIGCETLRLRADKFRAGLSVGSLLTAGRMAGNKNVGSKEINDPLYYCTLEDGRTCSGVAAATNGTSKDDKLRPAAGRQQFCCVGYENDVGFTHPFMMEFLSKKVVNWSHMVLSHCPGSEMPRTGTFTYTERMSLGYGWFTSCLIGLCLTVLCGPIMWIGKFAVRLAATQWFLDTWVGKQFSGLGWHGPRNAGMRAKVLGSTFPDKNGDTHHITCNITINGEIGYKETAGMCIESALCMAVDYDQCPPTAGVLSPASALGHAVVNRLNKMGRVTFSLT
eukprot:GHVS01083500.1.p1 GENE.GHVS01083500.1~~GHVS01083500.1.p1  ORF type:complete len:543 (-),score=58.11 GHVS01083500.1:239-1867(-)